MSRSPTIPLEGTGAGRSVRARLSTAHPSAACAAAAAPRTRPVSIHSRRVNGLFDAGADKPDPSGRARAGPAEAQPFDPFLNLWYELSRRWLRQGFEELDDIPVALHVEAGGGRSDTDADRKRRGREDREHRLVGPIVARRKQEVPRLPRKTSREVRALVHPTAANFDDTIPGEDLQVEARGERRQDVDELPRRGRPRLDVDRTVVPCEREVLLFDGGAGQPLDEAIDERPHSILPLHVRGEHRLPLAVRAVAYPCAVLSDQGDGDLAEPPGQIPAGAATHQRDMICGVGREVLEDSGNLRVWGDGIAIDGERDEGAVVVEEEETPPRAAVSLADLIPVRGRESLDGEVLGEPDDVVETFEEPHRPGPCVVSSEAVLHRPDAGRLLLDGHRQRPADRAHDLVRIVRVHDERLEQLPRGTGHLAQDEYAVRLLPRGDVLLRDEVHAVTEGCDQGDVARPVEAQEFFEVELAVQIADRRPCERPVAAVDAADPLVDLPLEAGVLGYALPRRDDGEDVRHLAAPLRMRLEEPAERLELLRDALRVVEAGNREDELRRPEGLAEPRDRTDRRRSDRRGGERLDVDPEREDVGLDDAVFRRDRPDATLVSEAAPHAPNERAHVIVRVEPDQVGAEHATQEFAVPRQETEDVVRRERDVQEESDPRVGNALPDHLRHEEQLVVVNPYDVIRAERMRDFVGKALVHLAVRGPLRRRVARVRREGMEQGPQRPVREAGIEGPREVIREEPNGASRGSPLLAIVRGTCIPHEAPGVIMLSSATVQRSAGLRFLANLLRCTVASRTRSGRVPKAFIARSSMGAHLRGSPSLVGRGVANPVRSALGGSNPPPRAVVGP